MDKKKAFARPHHDADFLAVVYDDGDRVIVKNWEGIVAFDGTRWLFDQCWKRGYFCERAFPITG